MSLFFIFCYVWKTRWDSSSWFMANIGQSESVMWKSPSSQNQLISIERARVWCMQYFIHLFKDWTVGGEKSVDNRKTDGR